MDYCYRLVGEDLTNLGGPMGSEYTTEKALGVYRKQETAKLHAEKHYRQHGGRDKVVWSGEVEHHVRSQDLLFVMYHIYREKIG